MKIFIFRMNFRILFEALYTLQSLCLLYNNLTETGFIIVKFARTSEAISSEACGHIANESA